MERDQTGIASLQAKVPNLAFQNGVILWIACKVHVIGRIFYSYKPKRECEHSQIEKTFTNRFETLISDKEEFVWTSALMDMPESAVSPVVWSQGVIEEKIQRKTEEIT